MRARKIRVQQQPSPSPPVMVAAAGRGGGAAAVTVTAVCVVVGQRHRRAVYSFLTLMIIVIAIGTVVVGMANGQKLLQEQRQQQQPPPLDMMLMADGGVDAGDTMLMATPDGSDNGGSGGELLEYSQEMVEHDPHAGLLFMPGAPANVEQIQAQVNICFNKFVVFFDVARCGGIA